MTRQRPLPANEGGAVIPPSPLATEKTKRCNKCLCDLPMSAMYFDRDNDKEDGFRTICKQCRSNKEREEKADDVLEKVALLDATALAALRMASNQSGSAIPHQAELYEAIVGCFGGTQKLAQHLLGTYLAAPAGSKQRLHVLQEVFRIGRQVSEAGQANKSLEDMGLDELQLEMEKELRRASLQELQRRTISAAVAPPPPLPTSMPAVPGTVMHNVD